MAKIETVAFEALMKKLGFTKAGLAERCKVARGTIQSAARGEPCNPTTLKKIADALGVSADELSGGAAPKTEKERRELLRKVGIHRVTVHLSTQMNLNYQLAADHYGVSQDVIFQAAPLCFAILAELSLKRRCKAIGNLAGATADAAGFEHLPLVMKGLGRLEEAARLETASINARDLDGRLADPDGESNAEGPFSAFMRAKMEEAGLPGQDCIGMDAFESPSHYALFAESLENIAGNSRRAEFALTQRYATVQQIPKELRWSEAEAEAVSHQRIAWLEGGVPEATWQEEEARREKLMASLGLDDLFADIDGGSDE